MIIWDLSQLKDVNIRRAERGASQIPIVKKHDHVNLGIRANVNMTYGKCLQSILDYASNEFIFIWVNLGFFGYFIAQILMIVTH